MKKEAHPQYQDIVFEDTSTGHRFVCGSTLQPKETVKLEGKEYPLYRVAISSSSHPFYTGSRSLVDTEGRVDKFKKRYQKVQAGNQAEEKKEEQPQEQKKQKKKK
jgi:large subunit ribosomal protein L31